MPIELQLTERERDVLLQLLDRASREIRVEVHHTRTPTFRDKLHQEEAVLDTLLEKVRATTA